MLLKKGLSKHFWVEAVKGPAYILDRTAKSLEKINTL